MKVVISFLLGIACGIIGFRHFLEPQLDQNRVLSQNILNPLLPSEITDNSPTQTPTSTLADPPTTTHSPVLALEISNSPSPTPIPLLTPKITAKPTSTVTPAPLKKPSPTLTFTATITPTIGNIIAPEYLEVFFSNYATQYGVDVNLLKQIAKCESNFNNNATSLNGLYIGLFQFSSATWINYRTQMGLDTNPDLRYGGEESIQTAAFALSKGGRGLWPSC